MLPLSGRVTAVMANLGDSVEQGQALVAIESPDAETAESFYLQSESACTQARAAVVKAQSDFDRASDLFEHDAVAKKEVLNTENALAQAKGSLAQAEAAREQAVRRLKLLGLDAGTFGQKVLVRAPEGGLDTDPVILLNQIRSVDRRRLTRRIGRLTSETMRLVDRALMISFGLIEL